MAFRFRKLYADLVAEDGTVLIVYMTWMKAWGLSRAMAGFELYPPAGTHRVSRALAPPIPPRASAAAGPLELSMEHAGGSLRLRYEPLYEAWRPASRAPFPGLQWSVRVPRASGVARWDGAAPGDGTARSELRGLGYVDWVELVRPTRLLGVRSLEWGRVHLPRRTIIFAGLESRSGAWWRRLVHWRGPEGTGPAEHGGYRLVPGGEGSLGLELPPEFPASAGSRLVLRPRRVLRRGSVLDPDRSPGGLERLVLRLVTGPSGETRWLSDAEGDVHLAEGGGHDGTAGSGTALHEVVRFGR